MKHDFRKLLHGWGCRDVSQPRSHLRVWWHTNDDLNRADVIDLWGIKLMTSTIEDDVTLVNTGHVIDSCPFDRRHGQTSVHILSYFEIALWFSAILFLSHIRFCDQVFSNWSLLCLTLAAVFKMILGKWRNMCWARKLWTNPGIAFLSMLWGHAFLQSSFFWFRSADFPLLPPPPKIKKKNLCQATFQWVSGSSALPASTDCSVHGGSSGEQVEQSSACFR